MTIKWGDPIECNGVRPDWLRDDERVRDIDPGRPTNGTERAAKHWNWLFIKAFCVRSDHPAYVALARGFTPWSGGDSAPDDWDGGSVLVLDGYGTSRQWEDPREINTAKLENWSGEGDAVQIIGYRKRVEYGAVHADGSRSGDTVEVRRMTEGEARDWIMNHTYTESTAHILHALGELGLVETRAERFTRETGHAVTEAVEAALNWKDTQA